MKEYIELAIHKGDLDKEGAMLRMNEMRVLLKAFAELNKGQYSEDSASYAVLAPLKNLPIGGIKDFREKVMNKVDVVGYYSDAEINGKAMKVVKLAQENECVLSVEYIQNRVAHYIMEKFYSERRWKI